MKNQKYLTRILTTQLFALFINLSPLFSQELNYTWLQFNYGADSTVEILGNSFDSDEVYSFDGSYLISDNFFITGKYTQANWDLKNKDDLSFDELNLGLGYKTTITKGPLPIDFFVIATYEHSATTTEVNFAEEKVLRDGGGLKAGLRAFATKNFIFFADIYQQAYGTRFWHRDGDLDGFSVELGGELLIKDNFAFTFTYQTGELDYIKLATNPDDRQIEVDRDQLFIGFKYYPGI